MTLTILHIAGLHAGAPGFKSSQLLDDIKSGVKSMSTQPVDYVAVCGNLTFSGRDEEFAELETLLDGLISIGVLKKDDGVSGRERIMIVPGRTDIAPNGSNRLDDSAFARFHEAFYQAEIDDQSVDSYSDSAASVRTLKDFTVIALPYWNASEPDLRGQLLNGAADALEKALSTMRSSWESKFVATRSRILLSADTPLLAPESIDSNVAERLRRLTTELHISLHLAGGEVPWCIPRQAFSAGNVTLTAGRLLPASAESPMRMNVVTMAGSGDRVTTDATKECRLQVAALRKAGPAPWEPDPFVDGHLDRYLASGRRIFTSALEELKGDLEEVMTPRGAVVVGFPGSGKQPLAEYLAHSTTLLGERVAPGEPIKMPPWVPTEMTEWLKDLASELTGRGDSSILNRNPYRRLVVLRTRPLIAESDSRRSELLEPVWEFFRNVDGKAIVILFLQGELDTAPEQKREVPVFRVGPLGDNDYKVFFEDRIGGAPLRTEAVRAITGKWAGYTHLILKDVATEFQRYPGTYRVRSETSARILRDALITGETTEEVDSFFRRFTLVNTAAGEILDHLRRRISHQVENCAPSAADLRVESPSELAGILNLSAYRVERALAFLVREKLLSKQPQASGGDVYTVALPLPFMIPKSRPDRVLKVFISYNKAKTGSQAALLYRGLIDRNLAGDKILPFRYPEEGPVGRDWGPEIGVAIKACRNFILVHSGGEEYDSPTVAEEVSKWKKIWMVQPQAKWRFSIVCFEKSGQPPDLNDSHYFLLEPDGATNAVVARLYNSFLPEPEIGEDQ